MQNLIYKKKKMKKSTKLFLILMMFVPFLIGVGYDFFMKIETVRLMFSDQYGTGFGLYWINLAFQELCDPNSYLLSSIIMIFKVFFVFNFIGVPMQLIISFFFYKKVTFTNGFRIIYYLPNLITPVITCLIFRTMFDTNIGPISAILVKAGMEIPFEGLFFSPNSAFTMIMIYTFWIGTGASTLHYTAAMLRIPSELRDAIRLDGVGYTREFIQFVIPMISPILSVMILSNCTAGFGLYGEVLMLTNPSISKVYTVSYLISEGAKSGRYFEAAGRGAIVTLIAIPIVLGVRWFFGKILPDVSY